MSFLSPEFVTSRANTSMISPRGMGRETIQSAVETLAFFFGGEVLEELVDELEDSVTDCEFTEASFSYCSLFSEDAEFLVDTIGVSKYVTNIKEQKGDYFKQAHRQRRNVPPGFKLIAEKKENGRHMYQITTIDRPPEDAIWIDAPVGRPDIAVEKAQDLLAVDHENLSVLKQGYEIVREAVPVRPEKDNTKEFDKEYQRFIVELESSRWLRKNVKGESKSMATPGFAKGGTHWKFDPIAQTLSELQPKKILVAGTGPMGHSGMCSAIIKYFPEADVEVYEPRAQTNTYHPRWKVVTECLDPEKYEGSPDLVITDVAVGDATSFDLSYTVKFAVKLLRRFPNTPLVYKDDIKSLTRRKCEKVYFGRGHNTEMFVLRMPGGGSFVDQETAISIIEKKRQCNIARDIFHCFKVRAPCVTKLDIEPGPFRVGVTPLCKPWGKHRKYNSGLSVASYVHLLAGFDVGDMDVDSPVRHLVEMVRAFVFVSPEFDATELVGSSRRLFSKVNKSIFGVDANYKKQKDRNNEKNPKARFNRKTTAVEIISSYFD